MGRGPSLQDRESGTQATDGGEGRRGSGGGLAHGIYMRRQCAVEGRGHGGGGRGSPCEPRTLSGVLRGIRNFAGRRWVQAWVQECGVVLCPAWMAGRPSQRGELMSEET